jgi:hypothetical protein
MGKDRKSRGQIDDEEESLVELVERLEIDPTCWDLSEALWEELRSIGFHGSYSTATEFLKSYLDRLRQKRHALIEEAVPAPSLEEQVEHDPRVEAAKRAYEEARAKALAEARKTI